MKTHLSGRGHVSKPYFYSDLNKNHICILIIFIYMAGMLKVVTTPIAGDVFVDGEYRGTGDIEIQIGPGQHSLVFGETPGYVTPNSISIEVFENRTTQVTAEYTRM